jgi:chromosome partitioning protein
MSVIAVVNRKGGSGKSTLATHLAAWLAGQGHPTVLGDVDRQQSTQGWLRRRAQQPGVRRLRLAGWNVDPRNVVRPPANSGHMVLDTPGGLRGFDLARVVMYADALLMPLCNSAFDRESAADCVAELRTLPRVASGRCRLAVVGMRIDARTRGEAALREWAQAQQLDFLGVLRDTQAYVRCIDDGLTIFDLPPAKATTDLAQWQPILDWLAPLLPPDSATAATAAARALSAPQHAPATTSASRIDERTPVAAQADAAVAPKAATAAVAVPRLPPRPPVLAPTVRAGGRAATPVGRLLDALAIPRFLQRNS